MASFENLASLDGWAFRSSFGDPWISDAFSRDNEALTKALHKSLSGGNADSFDSDSISPFLGLLKQEMSPTPTPTLSGVSGSDQEPPLPAAKRQRSAAAPTPAAMKAGKRKSRASKRSQTTFITADPANFRQMVQQVTGVRFAGGGAPVFQVAPILKPEPKRLVGRYQGVIGGGCLLPTLDTSAFLLDHQQQAVGGGMVPVSFPQPGVAADGGLSSGSGFEFSDFSNFPTLESWKVM